MRRNIVLALFAALTIIAVVANDEKDVLVLDDTNFDSTIKEHQSVLVEFYAPWCGHCKKLVPEYAQAATTLKKNGVNAVLAKVDADKHRELGGRFDVQGFPTLKWFVNGKPSEYKGGRTAADIVSWITKRVSDPATTLANDEDLQKFLTANEFAVVAFLDSTDKENNEVFKAVATSDDELNYGVISSAAVAQSQGFTFPSVVIYRPEILPYQARTLKYEGQFVAEEIAKFTSANSLSLVTEFSPESAPKIFGSSIKTQVLLFSDSKKDSTKNIKSEFLAAAAELVGKAIFVTVEADNTRVTEYFGVKEAEMPRVFVVRADATGLKKYLLLEPPSKDAILSFLQLYFEDKVPPHRKSEPIPETNPGAVRVVVGDNFDQVALDDTKDVLVEFYAPWCGHCKELEPIYEKVAKELQPIESLVIAKMDATANDAPESLEIKGFPTIVLFPAGKKSQPVRFNEDKRTAKKIKQFLSKNAGIPFTLPSKKKDNTEL